MEDLRGNLKQSSERLEKDLQQVKKYIEKEVSVYKGSRLVGRLISKELQQKLNFNVITPKIKIIKEKKIEKIKLIKPSSKPA